MLRTSGLRVLGEQDHASVHALLDADPVGNVFVSSRVRATGLDPTRLGAELWGYPARGDLTALCYAGANMVPVSAGPDAIRSFADHARWRGRRCSSIVGPVDAVTDLWGRLDADWGPARAIRHHQPVLVTESTPTGVEPDPLVRRAQMSDFRSLLPACVAMFTEEVGIPPDANSADGGALYRARVEELIRAGRSFTRIEDGRVVFKAEIGAVTPYACQVQGVWVHPDLRGRGHAARGMAAVVRIALTEIAPRVTLYVNDYNTAARAAYARVGFRQVDEVMSVLF